MLNLKWYYPLSVYNTLVLKPAVLLGDAYVGLMNTIRP
jgi:hypothetical protein